MRLRMEDEAFTHIESLITAMVEYVQNMPRAGEAQKKSAKQLINGAACVRARFICSVSNDPDAVNSASLTLANFKDKSGLGVLAKARNRFAANKEICSALDQSIKMIEMP